MFLSLVVRNLFLIVCDIFHTDMERRFQMSSYIHVTTHQRFVLSTNLPQFLPTLFIYVNIGNHLLMGYTFMILQRIMIHESVV